jgi:hypothetical protein
MGWALFTFNKEIFMRFLLSFLTALMVTLTLPSLCLATSDAEWGNAGFSFNHGSGWFNYQIGTKLVRETVHDLLAQWNFKTMGGAVSTIVLRTPGTTDKPSGAINQTLPKNAVITNCYIDIVTAVTSGGSATIAFSSGQAAGDLLAATAKSSFTPAGLLACTPTGSAASAIKLTADWHPSMAVAVAALTAGEINLHIQYVLSDP